VEDNPVDNKTFILARLADGQPHTIEHITHAEMQRDGTVVLVRAMTDQVARNWLKRLKEHGLAVWNEQTQKWNLR
jgi:hypothetical protein